MNFERKRIVFDTSSLISACLYPDREPAHCFRRALIEHDVFASTSALGELDTVLRRAKFDAYRTVEYRQLWLRLYTGATLRLEPSVRIQACRDPKDDQFLELAVCARAHALVSGDIHLLEMDPFQGIRVLTWKEFRANFSADSPPEK